MTEEQLEQTEAPLPDTETSEETEEQLEEMEAPSPETEVGEDVEEQNDLPEQGQGDDSAYPVA